ncbi:hypothetical protein RO3G_08389 [Rhizopus delemar RA 99-880]|uniref:WWE domain-containing protein n=1 Tax=Rhizopus delemar (strain RA 99-880 / ATCC MYA-4621 / FGSC 9543 / NRRL 43880) TaxID=246409 RepID=I1C5F4_RHIO9|nr:hypothetical protein RO3G_08389 [Rhizopus delemar RA 99-880]|eukprot:EIE83684.1 hypothetical protein RO3G_08389 [Rhizopus delemar RA 99-880]
MYQYPSSYHNNNGLPLTPSSISPTNSREYTSKEIMADNSDCSPSIESLNDYPQEITWLFFRDNQWVPFQSNNHYKIEQAFTLGDIKGKIKAYTTTIT